METVCKMMAMSILLLCSFLASLDFKIPDIAKDSKPIYLVFGRVLKVKSGKKFVIILENKAQYDIVLYGIECPPIEKACGALAKHELENFITGYKVFCYVLESENDIYQAIVYRSYVNFSVNHYVVTRGYSWLSDECVFQEYCDWWQSSLLDAKVKGIGIWGDSVLKK